MKEVRSRHRGTRAYFPPCMEGAKFMWLGPFSLRLRRSPYSLPIVSLFYANAELTYALRRRGINKKTAAERRALRCLRDSWKKSFVGDAADRRDAFLRGHRPPFFFFLRPPFPHPLDLPAMAASWQRRETRALYATFPPSTILYQFTRGQVCFTIYDASSNFQWCDYRFLRCSLIDIYLFIHLFIYLFIHGKCSIADYSYNTSRTRRRAVKANKTLLSCSLEDYIKTTI